MKKYSLLLAGFLPANLLMAQSINVLPGKKLAISAESQSAITVSAMGQEMNLETKNTITSAYEISVVTPKGYSMHNTVQRIRNTSKIMGMESGFDSDDENSRNDPKFAEILKYIGKPSDISIEGHKLTVTNGDVMLNPALSQLGISNNEMDEFSKFILYKSEIETFKPGYQWQDSAQTTSLKMVNHSVVTAVTDSAIEIAVFSDMHIQTTVQQMGMTGKISGKGTIQSKRSYNRSTGVLLREDSNGKFDAETEIMDQRIPMELTTKTIVTVQ